MEDMYTCWAKVSGLSIELSVVYYYDTTLVLAFGRCPARLRLAAGLDERAQQVLVRLRLFRLSRSRSTSSRRRPGLRHAEEPFDVAPGEQGPVELIELADGVGRWRAATGVSRAPSRCSASSGRRAVWRRRGRVRAGGGAVSPGTRPLAPFAASGPTGARGGASTVTAPAAGFGRPSGVVVAYLLAQLGVGPAAGRVSSPAAGERRRPATATRAGERGGHRQSRHRRQVRGDRGTEKSDGEVAGLDLVAHLEEQRALPAAPVRHAIMAGCSAAGAKSSGASGGTPRCPAA